MTRRRALTAAVAIGVLSLATITLAQEFDLPDFVTAEEEIPVLKPESGQQVLVLQIHLQSNEDGSVTAELMSQTVIESFAPKSASRSGGDWEVRVEGESSLVYRIPNPLVVEVEGSDDQEAPHQTMTLDSYDWTLVIPLYLEGKSLGAQTVEITDLLTGATILRTQLGSG
jgi:hypothetical protein